MTSAREHHSARFRKHGKARCHIGFADDMSRDDDGALYPVRSTLNGIRGYADKTSAEFFLRQNAGHKHIRHGYRFDNWQVPVHLQLVLPDQLSPYREEGCSYFHTLAIHKLNTWPPRFRTLTSQQTPEAAQSAIREASL